MTAVTKTPNHPAKLIEITTNQIVIDGQPINAAVGIEMDVIAHISESGAKLLHEVTFTVYADQVTIDPDTTA